MDVLTFYTNLGKNALQIHGKKIVSIFHPVNHKGYNVLGESLNTGCTVVTLSE